MKTRPITDAQEAPCEYVIKCVNKVCERNCPLCHQLNAICRVYFSYFDTISHSHTARQISKQVDVATLSNRRLESKGKWTGFNLICVYLYRWKWQLEWWRRSRPIGNSLNSRTRSLICWQWDISSLERWICRTPSKFRFGCEWEA